jgi:hypothetical protein
MIKYIIIRLKHDIFHLGLVIIAGLKLGRDLGIGRYKGSLGDNQADMEKVMSIKH